MNEKTETLMKNTVKLVKYAAITFAILFLIAFLGMAHNKMDEFIMLSTPVDKALLVSLLLVLGVLTSLICYGLSVAAFLTFWNMSYGGRRAFFRYFAAGLIVVAPLSAGVYYYDWHVSPRLTAVSVAHRLEMSEYGLPKEIEDESGIDIESFLSGYPDTMTKTRLLFQLDSLKTVCRMEADTCGQLLSCLPESLAPEAYQSYKLKDMGIAYRHAVNPSADNDSLEFIQGVLLHRQAVRLMEASKSLQQHVVEDYNRSVNTACIYIVYVIFALLGYLLRYTSMKKILGVLAVLIVALYICLEIGAYGKRHAEKVRKATHEAVR